MALILPDVLSDLTMPALVPPVMAMALAEGAAVVVDSVVAVAATVVDSVDADVEVAEEVVVVAVVAVEDSAPTVAVSETSLERR